jgi:hypothetical protein
VDETGDAPIVAAGLPTRSRMSRTMDNEPDR